MRQSISHHYDQLTDKERNFVDDAFNEVFSVAKQRRMPLAGDDRIARAIDALARAVIESRPKVVPLNGPGEMAAIYAEETGCDYATALIHCNMD